MVRRKAVGLLDDKVVDLAGSKRDLSQNVIHDGDVVIGHFESYHDGSAGFSG